MNAVRSSSSSSSSMMRVAVTATTRQQPIVGASAATNRAVVGSKCRSLTINKTPQNLVALRNSSSSSSSTSHSTSSVVENKIGSPDFDFANPPDVVLEVTPEMKRNNAILGVMLLSMVGGIFFYSMNAVGSQEQDGLDPLAQLKQEAQEALDREKKDHSPDERAQQLLQEFNRGDHDPDKAEVDALEELEQMEEEERRKNKKAWYKFW